MRVRRRAIAPWLFLLVGLALLSVLVVSFLAFAGTQGWLGTEFNRRLQDILTSARSLTPNEQWIGHLIRLVGFIGSAIGAALTLLASWHFAEMNLPQRLKDLKDAHARETNRITLLRKWLSGWSEREQARVLAASASLLGREASALFAAAQAAQQEQITAHLIRGYQYAAQGDHDKASVEFDLATKVRADDILSRDIAAGWARRTNRQKREQELLEELQQAASSSGSEIDLARALRRRAELLNKRQTRVAWMEARDQLTAAIPILQPLIADSDAKRELGRVLTLLCEVQCSRAVVRQLGGYIAGMRDCMQGVPMHARAEEDGGEEYGEERARRVEERIREALNDEAAPEDNGDQP
jgi:tetratricopeptide (TPR) repeat protein